MKFHQITPCCSFAFTHQLGDQIFCLREVDIAQLDHRLIKQLEAADRAAKIIGFDKKTLTKQFKAEISGFDANKKDEKKFKNLIIYTFIFNYYEFKRLY